MRPSRPPIGATTRPEVRIGTIGSCGREGSSRPVIPPASKDGDDRDAEIYQEFYARL
jgi:hypothetical protein